MNESSYEEVIGDLRRASIPIQELTADGCLAVTPAGGRIVALAFSPDAPNLLWSNPALADAELVKNHPERLVGGIGGDRLWFAPELAFHWDGVPDWQSFANYKVPPAADPGKYRFAEQQPDRISLHCKDRLPIKGSDRFVGYEVTRSIRTGEPPLSKSHSLMRDVDYVGIETVHTLQFSDDTRIGSIDLWHLLQIPVGSVLVVPKKEGERGLAAPLSYGNPGAWQEKSDHIMWRYGGEARAKFGLSVAVLTGRSAVLRQFAPTRWCLIVRQFPIYPDARYCDHPFGIPRQDQAFQAWDGFGFGEMEYHSPVLDAHTGPRELTETDQLWAFGGTTRAIAPIAEHLLGVDVRYLMKD